MNIRRMIPVVMAVALAFTMTACNGPSDSSSAKSPDEITEDEAEAAAEKLDNMTEEEFEAAAEKMGDL